MKNLLLSIKLWYYTLLESLDYGPEINRPLEAIEQSRQNVKLTRGVRKLVARLRSMSPDKRTEPENLLGVEPYKKTASELRQELEVRSKVIKNPILKTEDDLVKTVVKKAPIYQKEQELSEVRKAITACLKAAQADPRNTSHSQESRRLKAKLGVLKGEIERMKRNG